MRFYRFNKVFLSLIVCVAITSIAQAEITNFIYISDLHYGIRKAGGAIYGGTTSQVVNQAMIAAMNSIPAQLDALLGTSGNKIDFVAISGDISNRGVDGGGYESDSASWAQFQHDYLGVNNSSTNISGGLLNLNDKNGFPVPIFMTPGNHDTNNAIGDGSPMAIDNTSVVQIYNREIGNLIGNTPWAPPSNSIILPLPAYSINYSIDKAGVHMMFVNMWPDRNVQAWMDADLAKISPTTPVLLFTHAPMDPQDATLFANPSAPNVPSANYTAVIPFTIGPTANYASTDAAAQEVVNWLIAHPQVKATFSGHINYNDMSSIINPVTGSEIGVAQFRVDSPMKGLVSCTNDSMLSFQVMTIDTVAQTLTVRDFLWSQGKWDTVTNVGLSTAGSYGGSYGIESNGKTVVSLVVTLIPEPGIWALVVVGGVLMGVVQRPRRYCSGDSR